MKCGEIVDFYLVANILPTNLPEQFSQKSYFKNGNLQTRAAL